MLQSSALKRVGLWSICCFTFIALGAVVFPHMPRDVVYRVALLFVFPLWLMFVPVAMKMRDAKAGHLWSVLGLGTLAGTMVFLLLLVIQTLNGGKPSIVWEGYATVPNMAMWTTSAAVVGLIVSAMYGCLLKVFDRDVHRA